MSVPPQSDKFLFVALFGFFSNGVNFMTVKVPPYVGLNPNRTPRRRYSSSAQPVAPVAPSSAVSSSTLNPSANFVPKSSPIVVRDQTAPGGFRTLVPFLQNGVHLVRTVGPGLPAPRLASGSQYRFGLDGPSHTPVTSGPVLVDGSDPDIVRDDSSATETARFAPNPAAQQSFSSQGQAESDYPYGAKSLFEEPVNHVPRMYLSRSNGVVTPLIPADELPDGIAIKGISRAIIQGSVYPSRNHFIVGEEKFTGHQYEVELLRGELSGIPSHQSEGYPAPFILTHDLENILQSAKYIQTNTPPGLEDHPAIVRLQSRSIPRIVVSPDPEMALPPDNNAPSALYEATRGRGEGYGDNLDEMTKAYTEKYGRAPPPPYNNNRPLEWIDMTPDQRFNWYYLNAPKWMEERFYPDGMAKLQEQHAVRGKAAFYNLGPRLPDGDRQAYCPHWIRTRHCVYGMSCRYNHVIPRNLAELRRALGDSNALWPDWIVQLDQRAQHDNSIDTKTHHSQVVPKRSDRTSQMAIEERMAELAASRGEMRPTVSGLGEMDGARAEQEMRPVNTQLQQLPLRLVGQELMPSYVPQAPRQGSSSQTLVPLTSSSSQAYPQLATYARVYTFEEQAHAQAQAAGPVRNVVDIRRLRSSALRQQARQAQAQQQQQQQQQQRFGRGQQYAVGQHHNTNPFGYGQQQHFPAEVVPQQQQVQPRSVHLPTLVSTQGAPDNGPAIINQTSSLASGADPRLDPVSIPARIPLHHQAAAVGLAPIGTMPPNTTLRRQASVARPGSAASGREDLVEGSVAMPAWEMGAGGNYGQ
ncbi:MAG: hypothetical protein M1814_004978 [Vezdaea aestivalis]|nr:MAG: hypothetical protein M1814_004978 [Vezdaea aestivalis]